MTTKVPSSDIGMATAEMAVAFQLRRNGKITSTESPTASQSASVVARVLPRMKSAWVTAGHGVDVLVVPLQPSHHRVHLPHHLDRVGARLLHHLQGNALLAVEPGDRVRQRRVHRGVARASPPPPGRHRAARRVSTPGTFSIGGQEGAECRTHELCRGAVLAHQHIRDHRRLVDVDGPGRGAGAARKLNARKRRIHAAPAPRAGSRPPRTRRRSRPFPATWWTRGA